jgi:hypothetical protein
MFLHGIRAVGGLHKNKVEMCSSIEYMGGHMKKCVLLS